MGKKLQKQQWFTPIESGFTLIELIVVIGILSVLLSIVIIAINPARQFAQANNTKRRSDIVEILNAINQYQLDNKGLLPTNMPVPGAAAQTIESGTGNADVCNALIPTYISALPGDPLVNNGTETTNCTTYNTGYQVSVSLTNNRITITASLAELSATISATR